MRVGDLVKPNLRVRKMRFLKGHFGVVIKVNTDRSYEPHCLVEWSDDTRRITCHRYIKVVNNENR
jgi:hypothetical protein